MDTVSAKPPTPDDPYRKLKARAAKAGMSLRDYLMTGGPPLVEFPNHEERTRRLSKLRPLKLTETPEQTVRAMRDGR
jgi:hypothetical protein